MICLGGYIGYIGISNVTKYLYSIPMENSKITLDNVLVSSRKKLLKHTAASNIYIYTSIRKLALYVSKSKYRRFYKGYIAIGTYINVFNYKYIFI